MHIEWFERDEVRTEDGRLLAGEELRAFLERAQAIQQSPEYRDEILRRMREIPIYKPRPEVLLW